MDIELRRLRAENAQLRQDLASCRQQLAALHAALKRQQPYAARATRGGGEAPRNSLDALWREAVEAGAPAATASTASRQSLSLIHISEPTRPY